MMSLWKQLDYRIDPRLYLEPDDLCYHAREFHSKRGYQFSESNNLIYNFKMPGSKRQTNRWPHRNSAVLKFSTELSGVLRNGSNVTWIPSARLRTSIEYNNRFEDLFDVLSKLRPDLNLFRGFDISQELEEAHYGGDRRPDIIESRLNVVWDFSSISSLIILDDVISTGGHFKAAQRKALDTNPDLKIAGLFWALSISPTQGSSDYF